MGLTPYELARKNVLFKERYRIADRVIRELFSGDISKSTLVAIDVCKEGLNILEALAKSNTLTYTDDEGIVRSDGDFSCIPEANVKSALIVPFLRKLLDVDFTLENRVDGYFIDALSTANRPSGIEAKGFGRMFTKKGNNQCYSLDTLEKIAFAEKNLKVWNKLLVVEGDSYRINVNAAKQVESYSNHIQHVLTSDGLMCLTNGLFYAISFAYCDRFSSDEVRELSKYSPDILNDFLDRGVAYTGSFGMLNYPMFVFPIMKYNSETGKIEYNEEDIEIFRNLLTAFTYNTSKWREFLNRMHSEYIKAVGKELERF